MNINILFIFYWKCIMSNGEWMFYIAKMYLGDSQLYSSAFVHHVVVHMVNIPKQKRRWGERRQELIFKIYTLVLHKFSLSLSPSYPHPFTTTITPFKHGFLHSHSTAFCTKTFIRSSEPSLVIELYTMHNGNASYDLLLNVCLFH